MVITLEQPDLFLNEDLVSVENNINKLVNTGITQASLRFFSSCLSISQL